MVKIFSALNLTYLPLTCNCQRWNWHLSVFVLQTRQVVKASSGHYPQPFLISIAVKNLPTGRQARQIYRRNFKTAK